MAFIYALLDPRDGAPRYVGCTEALKQRMYGHARDVRRAPRVTPKIAWLRELSVAGLEPRMVVLDEVKGRYWSADVLRAERRWMLRLGKRFSLANGKPGTVPRSAMSLSGFLAPTSPRAMGFRPLVQHERVVGRAWMRCDEHRGSLATAGCARNPHRMFSGAVPVESEPIWDVFMRLLRSDG